MGKRSKTGLARTHGVSGPYRIFVRDLEVSAYLGIHAQEKAHRQTVIVNIELSVKGGAKIRDDINNVVSYEDLVRQVETIVGKGHVNLAETLAERIGAACLADKRVVSARVRIEKPEILPKTRSVGVEIEFKR